MYDGKVKKYAIVWLETGDWRWKSGCLVVKLKRGDGCSLTAKRRMPLCSYSHARETQCALNNAEIRTP